MAKTSHRIAGFDGIRALAVLMVFLDHRLSGANSFYLGGYGVQIFFVLSGFLIVGMLHGDQEAIARGTQGPFPAWKSFMIRRAARILPLYFGLLLLCALATLAIPIEHFAGWEAAIYALFLTNIYTAVMGQWMGPLRQGWSLSVEEQFYLLAAPLLLAVPPRLTRLICITTVLVAFCWHLALVLRFPNSLVLRVDSLSDFGFIAMGGVAALRPKESSRRLAHCLQPAFFLCLAALPFIPGAVVNPVVRQIVQPLLVAFLLAEIRDHQDLPLVRLLSLPGLVWLGTISYGFYLIHPFLTANAVRMASGGLLDMTGWSNHTRLVPLFLLSAAMAALSWCGIERPVIRATKAWLKRPSRFRLASLPA